MLTDAQIYSILEIYDSTNTTYETFYLIDEMKKAGHEKSNQIIRDALLDGLLYVDNITGNDGDVNMLLGLTDWGERLWMEKSRISKKKKDGKFDWNDSGSIRVPTSVVKQLDEYKKKHGYTSRPQAIISAIERAEKVDLIDDIRRILKNSLRS